MNSQPQKPAPQKIYTRQIKVPRRARPLTARELKKAVQKQLQPGEQLIQVALTGVEGEYFLVEIGLQQGGV